MLKIFGRLSRDATYLTSDRALELDGVRPGPAGYFVRGQGDAQDPARVHEVLEPTALSKYCGYEFVVAAPRAISVLLAIDDRDDAVVVAHRRAVDDLVTYLETHAATTHYRDHGRDDLVGGHFGQVVGYTHGMNRAGEPHLHDHLLVGVKLAGATNSLEGRGLFFHALTAGAIYRARLRYELNSAGIGAWIGRRGIDYVEGVDEGWREVFPGRHATRGQKVHWTREAALYQWLGAMRRFEARGVVEPDHAPAAQLFRRDLAGLHYVRRHHVARALANAAPRGTTLERLELAVARDFAEIDQGVGAWEVRRDVAYALDRSYEVQWSRSLTLEH